MRVPGSLASDARALDALKTGAARDPQGAARQAAAQFEALFMQMVLKSMRDATPRSGMLEGTGGDVYEGMLDAQFAQAMSGRPGGLADAIARQLARNLAPAESVPDGEATGAPRVSADGLARALQTGAARAPGGARAGVPVAVAVPAATVPAATGRSATSATDPAGVPRDGAGPAAFVERMWGAAAAAERSTGVPAGFIVGQAALESGWGRQEIRHADGRSAHNLFGIKAGPGWRGASVEATTTEYVDGRPVKSVERFRAYGSYDEAFGDWAKLMASNQRYAGVLQAGGNVESFARGLQRAGYATDPAYAAKLTRTIGQALSLRAAST
jgi:flagellar protein FlgJ